MKAILKGRGKVLTTERVLLLAILAMQGAILSKMYRTPETTERSDAEDRDDQTAPGVVLRESVITSKRDCLFGGLCPR